LTAGAGPGHDSQVAAYSPTSTCPAFANRRCDDWPARLSETSGSSVQGTRRHRPPSRYLLSGDLTYREIGRHLYLSANTVRTHAQRIRRKLGVSTRAGAVTRARQLGLI